MTSAGSSRTSERSDKGAYRRMLRWSLLSGVHNAVALFVLELSPSLLAATAFLGVLSVPMTARADPTAPQPGHAEPVEAQFRGCDSAGWCRFWIEPLHRSKDSLYRVRPDGVSRMPDDATSIPVRDRLNALL